MANLKKFVWEGARDGMKFEIWNHFPRLRIPAGSAQLIKLTPLHAKLEGNALGISGSIEIIMPDEAPRGTCVVILNGNKFENVPYSTQGNVLVIEVPIVKIELTTSWKYSWVGVNKPFPASVGLWPVGHKMEME